MSKYCMVTYPGQEKGPEIIQLKSVPDFLKAHPEGLYRSAFFINNDKIDEVMTLASQGNLPLSGPLIVIHAIRRAGDMILEECGYEGITIQLEVEGKRLPELPSKAELETRLKDDKTLVVIDGKAFKPSSEVFSFQNVYDDTVKFIDGMKKIGITQESMSIYATAEEISIEVHPGIFGHVDDPKLGAIFHALLCKFGAVKKTDRRITKTTDKTIILKTASFVFPILIPGSVHPALHRPKVGVGPSHFAYGTAAFSDYCGKKRSLDDCLKEAKAWLKFLEAPLAPIEKVKEALAALVVAEPTPTAPAHQEPQTPEVSDKGGFKAFKTKMMEEINVLIKPSRLFPSPWPELNKSLGGGFSAGGIHLIGAAREEGKASFLMNLALPLAAKAGVLYVSREHAFHEFVMKIASFGGKTPLADLKSKTTMQLPDSEAAKQKLKQALDSTAAGLPDTFYFRGVDSAFDPLNAEEIAEMVKMMLSGQNKILFLEGFRMEDFVQVPNFLEILKAKAAAFDFTVFISIHTPYAASPRPHLIEGPDLDFLNRWQHLTETIMTLNTEKINLKKFLAMSQGKVEPAMAEKLESRFNQAIGGPKLKSDTFTLARVLHCRNGLRTAILFLFQREIYRFFEGPCMGLGRP